jgi:hypothetical protein
MTDILALAEDYREDVFTKAEAGRDRNVRDFEIPAALLRKGANVLAIEIHTAPLTSDLAFVGPSLVEGRGGAPTSGGPTGSRGGAPTSASAGLRRDESGGHSRGRMRISFTWHPLGLNTPPPRTA